MSQHKYFIQEFLLSGKVYHGGIGCKDAELILLRNGYKPVVFPFHHNFSLKAKFHRLLYFLKILLTLPKHSSVVFPFETYVILHKYIIKFLRFRRSITLVCLVIDIDGLRGGDSELLKREVSFLRKIKFFIVHNNTMKCWIEDRVPGAFVETIEFFDFLTQPLVKDRRKSKHIVFAGNLAKSDFIKKLLKLYKDSGDLYFLLYGEGTQDITNNQPNIVYNGVYDPYELPSKLEGAFGLIWDGQNIEGLEGELGEYLKYNSPHKLSLYIVAGMPVITHNQAACAELVLKYKIGFTVNSIFEISKKIESLDEEEYMEMQKNCLPLAQRITLGLCLENALKEIERN